VPPSHRARSARSKSRLAREPDAAHLSPSVSPRIVNRRSGRALREGASAAACPATGEPRPASAGFSGHGALRAQSASRAVETRERNKQEPRSSAQGMAGVNGASACHLPIARAPCAFASSADARRSLPFESGRRYRNRYATERPVAGLSRSPENHALSQRDRLARRKRPDASVIKLGRTGPLRPGAHRGASSARRRSATRSRRARSTGPRATGARAPHRSPPRA
jgi:hypothetical protein